MVNEDAADATDRIAVLTKRWAEIAIEEEEANFAPVEKEVEEGAEPPVRTWTLVGRFLTAKLVKLEYMRQVLSSVWQPVMGVTVTEIQKGLFLFFFFHETDVQYVLNGGPWAFENSTLVCCLVGDGVLPVDVALDSVDMWVQLHDLPMGYTTQPILEQIGNFIGTFVKYDERFVGAPWLSFYRIRVSIPVNKPLRSRMKLLKRDKTTCWVNFSGFRGLSGGLALFWRKNNTARLLSYSKNYVDIEVTIVGFPMWRMTCYYGFPERTRRTESWDLLRALSARSGLPWIVVGDFNDLLFQYEKRGGNPHPNSLLRGFGDTIGDCGLTQMPMDGYPYTWEKGKGTIDWIEERLDKVLATDEWRNMVTMARVVNLRTQKSDHSAIFLGIHEPLGTNGTRRRGFRFETAWLYEEGCRGVVEQSWQEGRGQGLQHCIEYCGRRLTRWGGDRHHKYGKQIIDLKKKQQRLRGCTDPASLAEFQSLEQLLCRTEAQEDAYWRQRAKQHWLREADANTKFFHRYASHRKKKNTIVRLMNDNGDWVEGEPMNNVILEYFNRIFCSESPGSGESFFKGIVPRVTQAHNELLLRPFEFDEVKSALFAMFPDKAPGPDGMNPGFYQHFLGCGRGDVASFVVGCLDSRNLPLSLNSTDIILIPKKKTLERVIDLRPIALSNVIYRIMAKMITNRMKPLMEGIILESQSAFIPDRLITDNILVAAEVGHFLNRKQCGMVGWSALKLDMAKAYDRI
ncbi:PREDICTED: uncharacterized protein LOC109173555 [Ipomoea nil]|uniref:uncharacterized protein LOC109173555 n=1 Tax=Ipomoea nil TaxID=35883 RepID=UPI00090093FE|nr:PREDICTED: uncharacterized protein LOC109173555 [Ipomoea nil]